MTLEIYQKQEGSLRSFMVPYGAPKSTYPDPTLVQGLQSIVGLLGRIVYAAEQHLQGSTLATTFAVSTDQLLDKKIFSAKGQQVHMDIFGRALNNYLQTIYGSYLKPKGLTLTISADNVRFPEQVDRHGMRAYYHCGLKISISRCEEQRASPAVD